MLSFISIMTVGLGLATTEAAVVAALFLAFLQVRALQTFASKGIYCIQYIISSVWYGLGNCQQSLTWLATLD